MFRRVLLITTASDIVATFPQTDAHSFFTDTLSIAWSPDTYPRPLPPYTIHYGFHRTLCGSCTSARHDRRHRVMERPLT